MSVYSSIDVETLLKELEEAEVYEDVLDDTLSKAFVGNSIKEVYVNDLNYPQLMTFVTTDDKLINLEVEGDCCSESWFADFYNLSSFLHQEIIRVSVINLEEFDYNTEDGRGMQDVDEVYGYKIVTSKCIAVFSFRNSSNGYYGGWINLVKNFTKKHLISNQEEWMSEF